LAIGYPQEPVAIIQLINCVNSERPWKSRDKNLTHTYDAIFIFNLYLILKMVLMQIITKAIWSHYEWDHKKEKELK
jgi:hypothetical protein